MFNALPMMFHTEREQLWIVRSTSSLHITFHLAPFPSHSHLQSAKNWTKEWPGNTVSPLKCWHRAAILPRLLPPPVCKTEPRNRLKQDQYNEHANFTSEEVGHRFDPVCIGVYNDLLWLHILMRVNYTGRAVLIPRSFQGWWEQTQDKAVPNI